MKQPGSIAAVVAAAGMSSRMGQPKQLLPWNDTTVVEAVVMNLTAAGAEPVVVVVGYQAKEVQLALSSTTAITVANPDYAEGGLLQSLQVGLRQVTSYQSLAGTLLCLVDQPHIPVRTLRSIIAMSRRRSTHLVIPRYGDRRGHPIYLPQTLFGSALALGPDATLRDLVVSNESIIEYIDVDTPAILQDMDTPADYKALLRDSQ